MIGAKAKYKPLLGGLSNTWRLGRASDDGALLTFMPSQVVSASLHGILSSHIQQA